MLGNHRVPTPEAERRVDARSMSRARASPVAALWGARAGGPRRVVLGWKPGVGLWCTGKPGDGWSSRTGTGAWFVHAQRSRSPTGGRCWLLNVQRAQGAGARRACKDDKDRNARALSRQPRCSAHRARPTGCSMPCSANSAQCLRWRGRTCSSTDSSSRTLGARAQLIALRRPGPDLAQPGRSGRPPAARPGLHFLPAVAWLASGSASRSPTQ